MRRLRNHEAIIPRDLYMQVQEEMERRRNIHSGKNGKKRVYSSKFALSTIVVCGHFGDIYRRIHWNNRGCRSIVWRCASRLDKTEVNCSARTIGEDDLKSAVVQAINEAFCEKEKILPLLIENIESSLEENTSDRIASVDEQIKILQHELLATASIKNSGDELGMEIRRLRNEKQTIQAEEASHQYLRTRIDEMMTFLDSLSRELTEYEEVYVRTLIDKITIYDDHFIVEFKSGIEIQIN